MPGPIDPVVPHPVTVNTNIDIGAYTRIDKLRRASLRVQSAGIAGHARNPRGNDRSRREMCLMGGVDAGWSYITCGSGDDLHAIRQDVAAADHLSFDDADIEPGTPVMANSVLTLKTQDDMRANEPRGRRKIDPSEWPNLLAKRQRGATQAEIAREYGVSQGTVSQILKRAREDAANGQGAAAASPTPVSTRAEPSAPVADTANNGQGGAERRPAAAATGRTTLAMPSSRGSDSGESAGRSPAARSPSAERPATTGGDTPSAARTTRTAAASGSPRDDDAHTSDSTAPCGTQGARRSGNQLADRLRDAAEHVANLVDADTTSGDQLGQAVHEVRRALAAIEIDAAKRASQTVRPPTPEPDDIDDNEQFGRIKFFKPEKGFGFIIPDDGGDDVFLSSKTASAAGLDNLTQGDRVRFVPGPGSKGLEAKSIDRDD